MNSKKVYDEEWNEIEEKSVDLEKGHLIHRKHLIAHHPAIEASEAITHKDYIEFIVSGGIEIIDVIDKEAIEGKDAYDEYEDCLQYIPYSERDFAEIEYKKLLQYLSDTDYVVFKVVEGVSTKDDYRDVFDKRKEAREQISILKDRYKL